MHRLSALLVLLPLRVEAGTDNVTTILSRMSGIARSTRTLSGKFVQRKRLSLFASEIVTRGSFRFRRPSWFRWETLPPDRSVLVVDGDKVTLLSSGSSKTSDGSANHPRKVGPRLKAFLEDVMVWIGARPARRLTSRYTVRLEGKRLILTPKTSLRKRIRWISLHLDRDAVREVVMMETNGDRTSIAFESVVRNGVLK